MSLNISDNQDFYLPATFEAIKPRALVIVSVITSTVAVFTVLSNVIVIVALVKSRLEDGRNVIARSQDNGITNLTMVSMAVADVLFGVFLIPMFTMEVINRGRWEFGQELCRFKQTLNNVLCGVSIYHVFFMALDRFLAICKPMLYRLLTTRHGYAMVGLSWGIPGFILCFVEGFGWNHIGIEYRLVAFEKNRICGSVYKMETLIIVFSLCFYVPFCGAAVLYVFVLKEIRNFHKRTPRYDGSGVRDKLSGLKMKLKNFSKASSSYTGPATELASEKSISSLSELNMSTAEDPPTCNDPQKSPTHLRDASLIQCVGKKEVAPPNKDSKNKSRSGSTNRNLKAYRTIGCMFFWFTSCWVPSWVFVFVMVYQDYKISGWVIISITLLAYLNAGVNPFIYCFIRSVRRSVKSVLCPNM